MTTFGPLVPSLPGLPSATGGGRVTFSGAALPGVGNRACHRDAVARIKSRWQYSRTLVTKDGGSNPPAPAIKG